MDKKEKSSFFFLFSFFFFHGQIRRFSSGKVSGPFLRLFTREVMSNQEIKNEVGAKISTLYVWILYWNGVNFTELGHGRSRDRLHSLLTLNCSPSSHGIILQPLLFLLSHRRKYVNKYFAVMLGIPKRNRYTAVLVRIRFTCTCFYWRSWLSGNFCRLHGGPTIQPRFRSRVTAAT